MKFTERTGILMEKTAVYCKKYNKPSILYYDEIDLELSVSKFDNGMYKYREANIMTEFESLFLSQGLKINYLKAVVS